jgi:GNAT superfamily N-acetyltransferase
MEGGEPPSEQVKRDLVPGLRAHPACHVFLAYHDGLPVGFSICFLGYSTFLARPLLNIHDIFVDLSVRGRGIGAMLLERIEARARDLNCCRITLEVREDNRVARGLYRKVGFDRVVVGANRIALEFWHKPL